MKIKTNIAPAAFPLIAITVSSWLGGCLPATEPEDAKYDINSYKAVADDSGTLAGTWVLTSNKPSSESEPWNTVKARALFRLLPVEGSNTELQVIYCEPELSFQLASATIDGSSLNLNIDSIIHAEPESTEPFTVTDNAHIQKTVTSTDGFNRA